MGRVCLAGYEFAILLQHSAPTLLTSLFSLQTGGFWLSFAATLIPWFNAAAAYSKTGDHAEGALKPAYLSGIGRLFEAV
jgi:hypothetical protein